MIFTETRLPGVVVVELEPVADERGFFARSWCQKEFASHGLNSNLAQCNISFNPRKGTLRGMHYQAAPYYEAKLVRCTMGSIHDVVVDIRPDSSTFRQWFAIELTAQNRKMLYMAEGFAHGYQTLEENCEVFYQVSEFYRPELARGVRWDDPAFGIDWPIRNPILSDKDRECPFMP
ncbi:MAG TPA: dTDP-4-dehydrorhamnose 3,5-epimerase [Sulfuricella sp.]|nr:dTDP-4-dehydrorhamnose 3,5-epimerase [Sulfuricella sp.]